MSRLRMWTTVLLFILVFMLSGTAVASDRPNIPIGEDLSRYHPETDGCYGYLPVWILSEEGRAEHRLPVLVFQGLVLADAQDLAEMMPSLTIGVSTDMTEISLHLRSRTLSLTAEKKKAALLIRSPYGDGETLFREQVPLDMPCTLYNGRFWVPLTQTAALLGAGCAAGDGRIVLIEPKRDALDVLADLSSPTYRSERAYAASEAVREQWVQLSAGAGISLGVDALMKFDFSEFHRMVTGKNILSLIQRIAGIGESELADAGKKLLDSYSTFSDLAEMFASGYETPFNMDAILPSPLSEGAKAGTVAAGLVEQYQSRDRLAIDALTLFSGTSAGTALGEKVKKQADKTIESLQSTGKYAFNHTVDKEWPEIVQMVVKAGAKGSASTALSYANIAFMISSAYGVVSDILSDNCDWWADSMDSVKAFQDVVYGLPMQRDAEELLLRMLSELTEKGDAAARSAIQAGYLYLKTCQVTNVSAQQAFGQPKYKGSLSEEQCSGDMVLLLGQYPDIHDMPESTAGRSCGILQEPFLDAVEPLYMTLSGQVLTERERLPVADAALTFAFGGQTCGTAHGGEDGFYRNLAVPMGVPVLDEERSADENLLVQAYSPVHGEGAVLVPFEGGGNAEAEPIYLGIRQGISAVAVYDDAWQGGSDSILRIYAIAENGALLLTDQAVPARFSIGTNIEWSSVIDEMEYRGYPSVRLWLLDRRTVLCEYGTPLERDQYGRDYDTRIEYTVWRLGEDDSFHQAKRVRVGWLDSSVHCYVNESPADTFPSIENEEALDFLNTFFADEGIVFSSWRTVQVQFGQEEPAQMRYPGVGSFKAETVRLLFDSTELSQYRSMVFSREDDILSRWYVQEEVRPENAGQTADASDAGNNQADCYLQTLESLVPGLKRTFTERDTAEDGSWTETYEASNGCVLRMTVRSESGRIAEIEFDDSVLYPQKTLFSNPSLFSFSEAMQHAVNAAAQTAEIPLSQSVRDSMYNTDFAAFGQYTEDSDFRRVLESDTDLGEVRIRVLKYFNYVPYEYMESRVTMIFAE